MGDTLLSCAVSLRGFDWVLELLIAGADVAAAGGAALTAAGWNGRVDVIIELLARGADVHAGKEAALRGAAKCGFAEAVRVLLSHGADMAVAPADDRSAWYLAIHNGWKDVVEVMVQYGADATGHDHIALSWAAQGGRLPVLRYLVSQGADPRARGADALHVALQYMRLAAFHFLVEAGRFTRSEVEALQRINHGVMPGLLSDVESESEEWESGTTTSISSESSDEGHSADAGDDVVVGQSVMGGGASDVAGQAGPLELVEGLQPGPSSVRAPVDERFRAWMEGVASTSVTIVDEVSYSSMLAQAQMYRNAGVLHSVDRWGGWSC